MNNLVLKLHRGGESVYILSKGQKPINIGLRYPSTANIYIDSDENTIVLRESVLERDHRKLYEKIQTGEKLTDEEYSSLQRFSQSSE